MERALIIGAAGFVGGYLARHLKTAYGMEVSVTKLPLYPFCLKSVPIIFFIWRHRVPWDCRGKNPALPWI